MSTWTKVDLKLLDDPPSHVTPTDHCWYLRDLLVDPHSDKKPWELGASNQLIYDLKIDPRKTVKPYFRDKKLAAIETFAQELARNVSGPRLFAPIPSSKARDDEAYDNRLDTVLIRAQQLNPHVRIATPVRRTATIEASHTRSGSRSPALHLPTLAFSGIQGEVPGDTIFLLDDVLTSGSTFKACQQVIENGRPGITVAGVFWARRKMVPPPQVESELQGFEW